MQAMYQYTQSVTRRQRFHNENKIHYQNRGLVFDPLGTGLLIDIFYV